MPKSRYYKILGLPPTSTEQEVKKQYRILVMKYHPDRNPDPKAQELFIRITEAYDIILDKSYTPKQASQANNTSVDKKKEREERMKKARERFKQQELNEKIANIRFFQSLTNGKKWQRFKIISIVCSIFALLLIVDQFLPHHITEDELSSYSINVAKSGSGTLIGAIYTKSGDIYFINDLDYELFGETRYIDVESSWIFHNPIYIIGKKKTKINYYTLSFTAYNSTYLLVCLFLLPILTLWYKRMSILFTVLFYVCYYGVTGLTILFLLLGNRFVHLLTIGFY